MQQTKLFNGERYQNDKIIANEHYLSTEEKEKEFDKGLQWVEVMMAGEFLQNVKTIHKAMIKEILRSMIWDFTLLNDYCSKEQMDSFYQREETTLSAVWAVVTVESIRDSDIVEYFQKHETLDDTAMDWMAKAYDVVDEIERKERRR